MIQPDSLVQPSASNICISSPFPSVRRYKKKLGRSLTQKNEAENERKKTNSSEIILCLFLLSSIGTVCSLFLPRGFLDVISDLFFSQAVFASTTFPSTLSPVGIPLQPYDREVFLLSFYQSSTLRSKGEEERLGSGKRTYMYTNAYTWFVCSSFFLLDDVLRCGWNVVEVG